MSGYYVGFSVSVVWLFIALSLFFVLVRVMSLLPAP